MSQDTKQPSMQSTQPATPTDPKFDTPTSFPTPAHPTIKHLPKWTAVVLLLVIITVLGLGAFSVLTQQPKKTPATETVPQTTGVTAWQEYKNTLLGVAFTYPQNWKVQEDNYETDDFHFIDFYPSNDKVAVPPYTLNIYSNPQNLSLEAFDKQPGWNNCAVFASDDTTVKTKNGQQAFFREKGFCEPLEAKMYIWQSKNKIYQFRSKEYDKVENQDEVFHQIFNTMEML